MTAGTGTAAPAGASPAARPRVLRGDIEGLRAIAVLMVLLYHAGVPGLSGGFAGVDVFFVISGFLITSQLVSEARRTGTVSLARFYARRARRLLPAASLVLVVTAVAGWLVLPPGRRGELGTDVVGATLYVVNWVFAGREVDYLAEDSAPSLLQHYWSLSVEEQFYVVWPLLILLVLWLGRRLRLSLTSGLTLVLGLVVAASLAWSVLATASSPGTAYFATTTRVWQLGVGALLVLLSGRLARLPRRVAAGLAVAGLVAIALTVVLVDRGTPWPGSAALLPTLGTAAVIAAGPADVPPGSGAIGLVDPASRTADELAPVADPRATWTVTGTTYPAPDVATEDTPRAAYGAGCQVAAGETEITPDDVCVFGDLDGATSVALVGDSKALQWISALEPIAEREGWRVKVYTKSSCGFVAIEAEPDCVEYNAALSERLATPGSVPDLILTSMVRFGGEELGTSLADHLRPALDAGAEVVVLADNPAPARSEMPGEVTLYECVGAHPDDYTACAYASGRGSGTPALSVAAEQLDVPLLDLSPWICPGVGPEPSCPAVLGGVLVFRQGSHLTATYVRSLTPVLHSELVRLGVASTPLDEIEWVVAEPGPATTG